MPPQKLKIGRRISDGWPVRHQNEASAERERWATAHLEGPVCGRYGTDERAGLTFRSQGAPAVEFTINFLARDGAGRA